MDANLKAWSRRSLTTLGKITIIKTFALSQAIYFMQSLNLNESVFKTINSLLNKFIWNRHFMAAKAPERIKRDIVIKSIKLGGLGMLDAAELDSSLKLKALGRLLTTKHPFLMLIKDNINLSNFFEPKCNTEVDPITNGAEDLLRADRSKLWALPELDTSAALLSEIGRLSLKQTVTVAGSNSISLYMLWQRNIRKVSDLDRTTLQQIYRYIEVDKRTKVEKAVNLLRGTNSIEDCIYVNKKFIKLELCSSKEIRESRTNKKNLTSLKLDNLTLSTAESLSLFYRILKVSSVRHKNTL